MSRFIFYNFTDAHLIVFGFFLFMLTFLGTLVWVLFIQDKSFYENLSQQVLNNEEDYAEQQ